MIVLVAVTAPGLYAAPPFPLGALTFEKVEPWSATEVVPKTAPPEAEALEMFDRADDATDAAVPAQRAPPARALVEPVTVEPTRLAAPPL